MSNDIRLEPAKKVITYAHDGSENGWLIELWKDGAKTTAYLTAASPGSFKGYHLHRVRAARYVCVRGRMKIILYVDGKRQEHVLVRRPILEPQLPGARRVIQPDEDRHLDQRRRWHDVVLVDRDVLAVAQVREGACPLAAVLLAGLPQFAFQRFQSSPHFSTPASSSSSVYSTCSSCRSGSYAGSG